jgi:hypothetical protein
MPYPILLAVGAAAAAAGAGMQMAGAEETRRAVKSARNAELARQKGYRGENSATFADSLSKSGSDTAAEQLGEGSSKRISAYEAAQSPAMTPAAARLQEVTRNRTITTTTAPGSARAEQARQAESANVWKNLGNTSASKLGSYGDWSQKQNIKNTRAAQDINLVNNFARGSSRTNAMELEEASHEGEGTQAIGSVLQSIGMLGGAAGMAGIGGSIGAAGAGAPAVGSTLAGAGVDMSPAQLSYLSTLA